MGLVNPKSLGATLDAVNDAFFNGRSLSKSQSAEAAKLKRSPKGDKYDARRRILLERVLARCCRER